jgi:hypothetical protein
MLGRHMNACIDHAVVPHVMIMLGATCNDHAGAPRVMIMQGRHMQ